MKALLADGSTQLATRIPKRLWKILKFRALQEEKTLQALVVEALREHLDRQKAPA